MEHRAMSLRISRLIISVSLLAILATWGSSCRTVHAPATAVEGTFGYDLSFLKDHVETIVLQDGPSQLAVVPAWQGRVLTSTNGGEDGTSFGWINYDLIRSGELQPHINAFGGEDRIWLGPEGGQFSIFFEAGDPFDLEHWQTPAFLDSEPFETVSTSDREAAFTRHVEISNYSGAVFALRINRKVRLLQPSQVAADLKLDLGDLDVVAFESENELVNEGERPWEKETGLLSIWILGMYVPSPRTTVIIPYRPTPGAPADEKVVNDSYFGAVPPDRLKISDRTIFFKADGEYRSKIGLSPSHATSLLGSWDGERDVLTLVWYNVAPPESEFVNSMWEIQTEPYSGDVINSYNDGPPAPGVAPMGPFYELETSSPAAPLEPGTSITHIHRTIHLTGDRARLDALCQQALGVGIDDLPFHE